MVLPSSRIVRACEINDIVATAGLDGLSQPNNVVTMTGMIFVLFSSIISVVIVNIFLNHYGKEYIFHNVVRTAFIF
jgi:hypothetical protein